MLILFTTYTDSYTNNIQFMQVLRHSYYIYYKFQTYNSKDKRETCVCKYIDKSKTLVRRAMFQLQK